ncbi:hypothetical protein BDN70DRAFT_922058 [Pholiota conissans]|uniref:Uncharacterized protein n=1 Tax=Pholiota conissans TaxID=109636 RepID=A0A9P5YZR7_9AGAR|nr:hypothetical protein BDN70DRAFT_922058 [Pholiota conissans]
MHGENKKRRQKNTGDKPTNLPNSNDKSKLKNQNQNLITRWCIICTEIWEVNRRCLVLLNLLVAFLPNVATYVCFPDPRLERAPNVKHPRVSSGLALALKLEASKLALTHNRHNLSKHELSGVA